MESMLMESAMSQGIWVLLFVSLFIYTIKRYEKMESRQEEREKEYQELIRGLTDKLSIVSNIKEDIEEIKNKLNVWDERKELLLILRKQVGRSSFLFINADFGFPENGILCKNRNKEPTEAVIKPVHI